MFDATHRILAPAAVITLVAGLSGAALAEESPTGSTRGGSGIPQLASADFEGSGGRFSFVSASAQTVAHPSDAATPAAAAEDARPRDESLGGFLNSLAGDAVWAIETVLADWR